MSIDKITGGAEIVPLWKRRMAQKHPLVDELKAYWDGCREDDDLPRRSIIDPRAFKSVLSYSFVAERVRPGVVRFRLAGTHLSVLMGMEVRGMPVRAFFELADRPRLMDHLEAVFTAPAIFDADIISDSQDTTALEGRLSVLPLRDSGGAVTRALGCLITDGPPGHAPRRFRLRAEDLTPLGAGAPSRPRLRQPTPGLSEDAAAFRPSGAPVLTVVSGGKPH